MTAKSKADIKAFFQLGDKPTESQFVDLIDSYVDKSGPVGTLEAECSGGGSGPVVVNAGLPSIGSYAAFKNSMGITVSTTADVVTSIPYATTAQANAGTDISVAMNPVLTKNAVNALAFTSANFATTAQANAGTNGATLMNPVLTKNAIESLGGIITLGTPVASTSGTAIDFNSIPAGTKEINVHFNDVSLSGTDHFLIQIGDSGGIETTGYFSTSIALTTSTNAAVNATTGFVSYAANAGGTAGGTITLRLMDSSNNTWTSGGLMQNGGQPLYVSSGRKSLSGVLDRVRITTTGSNTFDAGIVNISYK